MRSWPPTWAWIGLKKNKNPTGEVGILKEVTSDLELRRCFLTIEYENEFYMGCLFVRDRSFCRQLSTFLKPYVGYAIEQIADLDVSDTL
jgi:hypothetical protein